MIDLFALEPKGCTYKLDYDGKHLHLSEHDELYMPDDRPEWIDTGASGADSSHDHVVSVAPFQPAYKLYGVQVIKHPHQDDPTDTIPNDTELMDKLRAI